jgi:predicted enzyme related to lactoylglutathione lyase
MPSFHLQKREYNTNHMNTNPVIHFEMGYVDRERMKKFYTEAFGWKLNQLGADMGNYVVAQTTEVDEKGLAKIPGTINGGFYQKTENPSSHAPSVVIGVQDIKAVIEAVKANGGTILGAMNEKGEASMEPMMIPGIGLWISFQDTEGNRVSLMQPIMPQ